MKVSLKATYGIMAIVDLALQNGSAPVQSKAIARRKGIPVRFLEQVLHAMKQAGLIDSHRGAQGGYILGKIPSAIFFSLVPSRLATQTAWSRSNAICRSLQKIEEGDAAKAKATTARTLRAVGAIRRALA